MGSLKKSVVSSFYKEECWFECHRSCAHRSWPRVALKGEAKASPRSARGGESKVKHVSHQGYPRVFRFKAGRRSQQGRNRINNRIPEHETKGHINVSQRQLHGEQKAASWSIIRCTKVSRTSDPSGPRFAQDLTKQHQQLK